MRYYGNNIEFRRDETILSSGVSLKNLFEIDGTDKSN